MSMELLGFLLYYITNTQKISLHKLLLCVFALCMCLFLFNKTTNSLRVLNSISFFPQATEQQACHYAYCASNIVKNRCVPKPNLIQEFYLVIDCFFFAISILNVL